MTNIRYIGLRAVRSGLQVFANYGSAEHKARWLTPLLEGTVRSTAVRDRCLCVDFLDGMTESTLNSQERITHPLASTPSVVRIDSKCLLDDGACRREFRRYKHRLRRSKRRGYVRDQRAEVVELWGDGPTMQGVWLIPYFLSQFLHIPLLHARARSTPGYMCKQSAKFTRPLQLHAAVSIAYILQLECNTMNRIQHGLKH